MPLFARNLFRIAESHEQPEYVCHARKLSVGPKAGFPRAFRIGGRFGVGERIRAADVSGGAIELRGRMGAENSGCFTPPHLVGSRTDR